MDLLMILFEIGVVAVKVMLVYMIINIATDLSHEIALETAILVGAVDFLNGQRNQFRTVSDFKEKLTMTEKGKKLTRTITRHREGR